MLCRPWWARDAEVVQGDVLDADSLTAAMDGIDTAFYCVHSMGSTADFEQEDRQAARNFADAARRAGVRRIIYLGGLGNRDKELSKHLRSRQETGDILRSIQRAGDRIAGVDRHRIGKSLVRDDSRPGGASADHDLPEVGPRAGPADRDRRRAGVPAGVDRVARQTTRRSSRSAGRIRSRTARSCRSTRDSAACVG